MYRVLSMYRLAQHLKKRTTGKAYADFTELEEHYEKLVEVNQKLNQRIRDALAAEGSTQDGALNAITLLDALAQYVSISIDEALEALAPIFSVYWENELD